MNFSEKPEKFPEAQCPFAFNESADLKITSQEVQLDVIDLACKEDGKSQPGNVAALYRN